MTNPYNQIVGKRIRDGRKRKRLSMKELGAIVGLHESTVSRYEKGEIKALDVDTLKEFAKALELPASYLTGWEDTSIKKIDPYEKFRELCLTEKELDELYNYAEFIKSKRK